MNISHGRLMALTSSVTRRAPETVQ
jgi:hypothetical protein